VSESPHTPAPPRRKRRVLGPGENRSCPVCGKVFYVTASLVERGLGLRCSAKCAGNAMIDMQGKVFHPWRVLRYSHKHRYKGKNRQTAHFWVIECVNCGKQLRDSTNNILVGYKRGDSCRDCGLRPKGEVGLLDLYDGYQRHARDAERLFELSVEEFKQLTSSCCYYCGVEPKSVSSTRRKTKWGDYYYNGLDRVDNAVGYVAANCLPCCWLCNRAKAGMSFADFTAYLRRVAVHQLGTGGPMVIP
jgi:hypothetical protein